MLSTKVVCSECLHNLSSNYQHRISEWGERKRASAPADKSSANMQECTEKPWSQHTPTGRLSTNCRQMLQEHVVFFQSKIQCISGNFCFKKKKKNFENISRKNWMHLKNGPLSVKEKHRADLLLLAHHFPLQMRFTHIHGNYENGQMLTIWVTWETLAIYSSIIQPFIHHIFIRCLTSAKHMLGIGWYKENISQKDSWSNKAGGVEGGGGGRCIKELILRLS